jgi:hypothetical protein
LPSVVNKFLIEALILIVGASAYEIAVAIFKKAYCPIGPAAYKDEVNVFKLVFALDKLEFNLLKSNFPVLALTALAKCPAKACASFAACDRDPPLKPIFVFEI